MINLHAYYEKEEDDSIDVEKYGKRSYVIIGVELYDPTLSDSEVERDFENARDSWLKAGRKAVEENTSIVDLTQPVEFEDFSISHGIVFLSFNATPMGYFS